MAAAWLLPEESRAVVPAASSKDQKAMGLVWATAEHPERTAIAKMEARFMLRIESVNRQWTLINANFHRQFSDRVCTRMDASSWNGRGSLKRGCRGPHRS